MSASDEAQAVDISMTRARTYSVRERPRERTSDDATRTQDTEATRPRPAEYAIEAASARYAEPDRYDSDADRVELEFAGGSVQLSAEAMAQGEALSGTAPLGVPGDTFQLADPAPDNLDETETDSSLNDDRFAPDLGERVL